ncbi:trifunctional transcriptional regulator/proline dehydrogenase/L-glutamate gamma-semialdehyde dehydrogenase [Candidatus Pantoea edessiphila]|uniref:Bifunctional protein PutA n=1 Tax=Candidatus Pantoea edessiphila TaxID=2044610 RepID=A0A2P5SYP0_9GAMM|nr:trifunctional transcriptional regulator/proline dehydrogenase/L-glutamate gamma-semialdehyde dehydrogenase [Candidatus Pantoea edessiphila]MBK4775449.1 trifunctional transcriptional regulator/proline dehydrogenase/L-glutamate gamma-semialdehyde dehydrogenase [Pantoea sp. Edef]PPI87423.1 trifunctional transcriptional regulator/proline dehydrogenase/L-glutamate gamma-semialdehyde dehydrogenase [Candidatus Pantoea edessiphila]
MATSTMGIKLDNNINNRIKIAARNINKTTYWLIKQAILNYLIKIEEGIVLPEISYSCTDIKNNNEIILDQIYQPFSEFAEQILVQTPTRSIVTEKWCIAETELVPILLEQARIDKDLNQEIHNLALKLSNKLRNDIKSKKKISTIAQSLLKEFPLSSSEGIALMCLAESLLRIPDNQTRDLLIHDKIKKGEWHLHAGKNDSLLVNIVTRGLMFIKKCINNTDTLTMPVYKKIVYVIYKNSNPLIRIAVNATIRLMGKQFVIGENINSALKNARNLEKIGFSFSYDMLGEAALTSRDADNYLTSYMQAIHAIGKSSKGLDIYNSPGISIKLSALHPRYNRAQYSRIIEELYPKLKSLILMARFYNIGINIDAEESDRLELSLDLLEKLCFESELASWNGIGFVIQAYMKRCPFVIDELISLAQRSKHRIMVRLVKGAYWDTEIKRAQIEGLEDYPVYTRKTYTDISYIACARKLLSVPKLIYPQFATHNAHTLATIYHVAGNDFYPGQYEFQCLYGMGEPMYQEIVKNSNNINRPCRIYAPVGTHEKLLAYLVRRLLENGANNSFVNKIVDKSIPIEQLIADPVSIAEKMGSSEGIIGLSHPKISLPVNLYGVNRTNSKGINISNEHTLNTVAKDLLKSTENFYIAEPIVNFKCIDLMNTKNRFIINPAIPVDIVGQVRESNTEEVSKAIEESVNTGPIWFAKPPRERAIILENAAKIMQSKINMLVGILIRESGKTYSNAIAEVREAIDFIFYYASIIKNNFKNETHLPLGPVVCISPWNFPLAIFTGQITAALATGNTVLAKPAEQTPLIAAQVVDIFLSAGISKGSLQLITGSGKTVGKILVSNEKLKGVLFTGSNSVAKNIQKNIAGRLDKQGHHIPLIAETGGINAMIVDSSALTEQVVIDVISSAFDSAGQRCSALRILCIQEEVADRTIEMLLGAIAEYTIGNPDKLCTDIGPIINSKSTNHIKDYIAYMRNKGFKIYQAALNNKYHNRPKLSNNFIKPTIIEIDKVSDLKEEVFGPVLHIVRFNKDRLLKLIEEINILGYGLTLGLHTRVDDTINQVISKAKVGNLYINRNMIGAVVGVQPFGGEGLSGTGPKAGGPLYLYRLLSDYPNDTICSIFNKYNSNNSYIENKSNQNISELYSIFSKWADENEPLISPLCLAYSNLSRSRLSFKLIGPTGEENTITLLPRERVFCIADNKKDILIQLAAILSIGSKILWQDNKLNRDIFNNLPDKVKNSISLDLDPFSSCFDAVIFHGNSDDLTRISKTIAEKINSIISIIGFHSGETNILLERFLVERCVSINTTASGGNTTLMSLN